MSSTLHGTTATTATEPVQGLRLADTIILVMGSAPLVMQKQASTREAAEQFVDRYWARPAPDANDMIYYLNASRNYDPSPRLESITDPVLWINSADDYINPPELGIAEKMVKRMPHARFILIPISDATRGHGFHGRCAACGRAISQKFMQQTRTNSQDAQQATT